MTTTPQTIEPDALAQAALALMEEKHISALFVTTATHTVAGIVHMHDLLRAGII